MQFFAHFCFQYLFNVVAHDLTKPELVAVVMVLVDVMYSQTCGRSTVIVAARHRLQRRSSATKQHR